MSLALALLIAFILDLIFGDPAWLPHPVVALGKVIAYGETTLRRFFPKTVSGELQAGTVLAITVPLLAFIMVSWLVAVASWVHPVAGWALQGYICFQLLATKSLRDASQRVYRHLVRRDLPGARRAVSHIVGRDTSDLDLDDVTRATVETVAENASDGVIAPMLYFAIGGAPLAMAYKAINTMDSMIGYKNTRYLYFGRSAARLDDAANFIPARLTGILIVAAAAICRLDWPSAWRIFRRDRLRHSSPNAGHPEAACAGALGIRLGGNSVYGGVVVHKPTLGDNLRRIEAEDIPRANRLLYGAAILGMVLLCGVSRWI